MRSYQRLMFFATVLVTAILVGAWQVQAIRLPARSLELSNNTPNEIGKYNFGFDYETYGALGSISIELCLDSPLPNVPCVAPPGLDFSRSTLASQTGETGFAVDPASTNNIIILSRSPVSRTAITQSLVFDNVTNPSSTGTYFAKIRTFASNDATGPVSDYGGLTFYIATQIQVRAEVPPYLTFCAAKTISGPDCTNIDGSTVDFGDFNSRRASASTSQFQVTTNAASGYNVRVAGTTMTSGNDIINALATNGSSQVGTAQFGLNLRANSAPTVGREAQGGTQGQPMPAYGVSNSFRFVSGEVVASAPRNDVSELFTVAYLVNVPADQAPGLYVTTLTYICLANF